MEDSERKNIGPAEAAETTEKKPQTCSAETTCQSDDDFYEVFVSM